MRKPDILPYEHKANLRHTYVCRRFVHFDLPSELFSILVPIWDCMILPMLCIDRKKNRIII